MPMRFVDTIQSQNHRRAIGWVLAVAILQARLHGGSTIQNRLRGLRQFPDIGEPVCSMEIALRRVGLVPLGLFLAD
jgi:hypothetical protein